jgi:hypothetical protein
MAATNKKYASERMRLNNPMHKPGVKERVSKTLQKLGHKPRQQGGNGKPLPRPQQLLMDRLGLIPEKVIKTNTTRGTGLSTHYKIDLAHPTLPLAIEIDGFSHAALTRKAQDAKKEAFLRSRGWTVLRFSNQEVLQALETCVQTILSTISRLSTTTITS